MTPELRLTPEELQGIAALAERRGFADMTAYVRELIKVDAEQHEDDSPVLDDDEDDGIDPLESIRISLQEIKRGETMSVEEFLKANGYDGQG